MPFETVPGFGLGRLIDDPALMDAVNAADSLMKDHANLLLQDHWSRLIPASTPTAYDLDILIRAVDAKWCTRFPEANGIHGQWSARPTAQILLVCAVPDATRLLACFIHEFGHYLDYMNRPRVDGFPLTLFLRDETAAEQLVLECLGPNELTHNRTCAPATRAEIHRLLTAEADLNDNAAQNASLDFLDCDQKQLDAYALANELVQRRSSTFADILHINDKTFQDMLLSSPDLWSPPPAGEHV